MSSVPPRWTPEELRSAAAESASLFRQLRLPDSEAWSARLAESNEKTVLSGVFKVVNLEQAQRAGLTLFWAHRLHRLGEFIAATRPRRR